MEIRSSNTRMQIYISNNIISSWGSFLNRFLSAASSKLWFGGLSSFCASHILSKIIVFALNCMFLLVFNLSYSTTRLSRDLGTTIAYRSVSFDEAPLDPHISTLPVSYYFLANLHELLTFTNKYFVTSSTLSLYYLLVRES